MANIKSAEAISIMEVHEQTMDVCILGTTPLIMNRMSEKVWHELLAPKGKKTTADKAATMKHDPVAEFRSSPYRINDDASPTLLGFMPSAFKRAMGTAALDMQGAKRAQILRLVYVEGGELMPIYGLPRLFMAIVRSADINKTPDVRTRAILAEWACRVSITWPSSILRQQSIINLLSTAGRQSGIGDWRQEKGSGNFGGFKLVEPDDADFVRLCTTQGRQAQIDALADPICYNDETSEMLAWFDDTVKTRGMGVLRLVKVAA